MQSFILTLWRASAIIYLVSHELTCSGYYNLHSRKQFLEKATQVIDDAYAWARAQKC